MNWLPMHKCSLHLTHNEHRDMYESVESYYERCDFVSEDEYNNAVATDSVWDLQWYPDTPIGFYRILASSLEALQQAVEQRETKP